MVQPWKRFVSYSESKTVTHDPAFLILGIYLREMKTYVHTELVFKCSWQHLHTKAPKWKQLRCASTNEQINKCSIATQHNIQFSSVTQSCPTLCVPMDYSMPSFPVHHQLPQLAQTHVYWVGDAIQPSHPLLPPSPLFLNLSQHQGLFQSVGSSHQMAKVLKLQH